MDYQLAKELKDAGFPQRPANGNEPYPQYTGYGTGFVYPAEGDNPEVYVATLEELIEACGEDFGSLNKIGNVWDAEPITGLSPDGVGALSGNSPTEAVARLWLELNKKQ